MSIYRVAALHTIKVGQFNKIESLAIHYDWNLAFSGKSLGNQHLERTVKLVKHLWEDLHKDDDIEKDTTLLAELDVAIAGALLHDIGLVEGNMGHCFTGKTIAKKLLEEIPLSFELIDRILHCIEAHDGEIPAQSIEAKLVHDADTLDKLGPVGVIRHIWKLSLLGEKNYDVEEYQQIIPEHLEARFNNLYLEESKSLGEKLKVHQKELFTDEAKFTEIVDFIKSSASSGIPVDFLVKNLIERVNFPQSLFEVITKQLEANLADL